MPRRRQIDIDGGKINVAKAFKKLGRDIDRGFKKEISRPIRNKVIKPANKKFFKPAQKALAEAGSKIGEFTNKELLPGVVSIGIPLVSTALGALGTELGLPPEITSEISENLMKELIPKQYQSKNKYVKLISSGIDSALSGDPRDAMNFGKDLTGTVAGDVMKLTGKHKVKQQIPTKENYNPDDPYNDLLLQLFSNYQTIPKLQPNTTMNTEQTINYDEQDNDVYEQNNIGEQGQLSRQQQMYNENSLSDAIYKGSQIAPDADSLIITSPPYQQKEGSKMGLLGAGVKKRRGRPRKKHIEEYEIYTKQKPTYKKFSHAKNSSLEQLLEANADREAKEAKKAMKNLVSKQTNALTALGYGVGRHLKGSQEMKDRMAILRSMKK